MPPTPATVPPTPAAVPPTPAAVPPTPAIEPLPFEEEHTPDDESDGYPSPSPADADPMDFDLVPECPPASPGDDVLPAAVTRQLPCNEVLSREDAFQAIRKEFQGIASMGTWDWDSVAEESSVKRDALNRGETIHLADLLAICSEKHVELEPAYRQLKGRVCYRGDAARTESGNIALYQTLSASPASIVAANAIICFGLMRGCKVSTADAVKAYLQSDLKSLCATWVRLPNLARNMVRQARQSSLQASSCTIEAKPLWPSRSWISLARAFGSCTCQYGRPENSRIPFNLCLS